MREVNSPYYPAYLKVKDKKCVVIGGGEVALRKVKSLLEHGAYVEVISPEISNELNELVEKGLVTLKGRRFQPGDLKGAFIAVAATDNNQVNMQAATEAREQSVPVNVVDDPEHSDFIVPSTINRGDVVIAISTGGKSPALARKIRTRIEQDIGEEFAALALLIEDVRTELKERKITVDGDSWQRALELDKLFSMLKQGERQKAREALLKNLDSRRE
jgi:siroheme synthase-like protein